MWTFHKSNRHLPFPQICSVMSQFPRCPCQSSPYQLPVPNSTRYTEAEVTTAPFIVIATTANWYSGLQSARLSTCSHATYQTLRLDGSQKVHVQSDPHLQGLRPVSGQLPTVVPAGGDHSFQQLWTEAGVAEFWTGSAQKYGGYIERHVMLIRQCYVMLVSAQCCSSSVCAPCRWAERYY